MTTAEQNEIEQEELVFEEEDEQVEEEPVADQPAKSSERRSCSCAGQYLSKRREKIMFSRLDFLPSRTDRADGIDDPTYNCAG